MKKVLNKKVTLLMNPTPNLTPKEEKQALTNQPDKKAKNTKENKPTNSPDTPPNGSTPNGMLTPPHGPNGRSPSWTFSLN